MTEIRDPDSLLGAALCEAEAFELPQSWPAGRRELKGVTIDSERTMDRDDAVWLERDQDGFAVHVAISDVGSFLSPSSAVAAYAETIGQSRYLRYQTLPMLPPRLSEGVLSLLDTQETPVLSLALSVDFHGEVVSLEFVKARLQPRRLTYNQVNALNRGQSATSTDHFLVLLEKFALNLIRERQERGAFAYYDPTTGVMTDEEGRLFRMGVGTSHVGELIVQEFMILANTAVAEYLWRNHVPALFRNHEMAVAMSVEQAVELVLSGSPEGRAALAQGFGRARYGTTPHGHAALNLDAYAHWTSPLRRFADFVNHMNLVAHLENRAMPYARDRLDEIAEHLNRVADEIRDAKARHFKAVTHAADARLLNGSVESLLELDEDTFYRLVKVAHRTGLAPEGLAEAIVQRARSGALGPRELTALVFAERREDGGWARIDEAIVAHMRSCPPDAVSALSYAQQAGLLSSLVFESAVDEGGFACRALCARGEGTAEVRAVGASKRLAQQTAAIKLVAALLGSGDVEGVVPDSHWAAEETPAANTKGALQEELQRLGQPEPDYETTEVSMQGSSHVFEARLTVAMGGRTLEFIDHGPTKKRAEATVAGQALRELRLDECTARRPAALSDNPVSALQEWCQNARIPLPRYQFMRGGSSHVPFFDCSVSIETDAGPGEHLGTGRTKQEAKADAARHALSAVHPAWLSD
jgi:ribonuclease R